MKVFCGLSQRSMYKGIDDYIEYTRDFLFTKSWLFLPVLCVIIAVNESAMCIGIDFQSKQWQPGTLTENSPLRYNYVLNKLSDV